MSSGLGIDGMISGFKTTDVIAKLMSIESRRGQLLVKKSTGMEKEITALQALNAKISSIASAANGVMGKKDALSSADLSSVWAAAKATSSDPTVGITAKPGADISQLSFSVDKTAQSQVSLVSAETLADIAPQIKQGPPPQGLSIIVGNQIASIYPSSGSAQDIAEAINKASDIGVRATAVRVGTGADGQGQYILQITGTKTGENEGKFSLHVGNVAEDLKAAGVKPETSSLNEATGTIQKATYKAEDLAAHLSTINAKKVTVSNTQEATSAQITLWGGTAQERSVTSENNTFSQVLDDVDITVGIAAKDPNGKPLALTPKDVKVSVESDPKVASDKVKALVSNIDLVLSELYSQTKAVEGKDDKGNKTLSPGVLGTNSLTRGMSSQISSLIAGGIEVTNKNGTKSTVSLSEFGITMSNSGAQMSVKFDEAKFAKAMAADPERVQEAMTAFAAKTEQYAKNMSDSKDGLVTQQITSKQSSKTALNDRIDAEQRRLDMRKASLQKRFNAMESALAKMQKQYSALGLLQQTPTQKR
ncbi:MAG: flagellar filament capping protein FliD [Actinomycetaceae bacterium]|nr:flagellar filament capping protein FliD [Actinomycetaceae bacterium]